MNRRNRKNIQYGAYLLSATVNMTFHPLVRFPDPKPRAATCPPPYWNIYTEDTIHKIKELLDKDGNAVRISPSTIRIRILELGKVR